MDHVEFMKKALTAIKDRGQVYGGVEDHFARAAAIASLWLDKPVTPRDIALIIASVKMARIATTPGHEDSFIDLCNYVSFGAAFSRAESGLNESVAAGVADALRADGA